MRSRAEPETEADFIASGPFPKGAVDDTENCLLELVELFSDTLVAHITATGRESELVKSPGGDEDAGQAREPEGQWGRERNGRREAHDLPDARRMTELGGE